MTYLIKVFGKKVTINIKVMYLLLKTGENEFIWDSIKKVMFVIEQEDAETIPFTLDMLAKFNPYLLLIDETNVKPDVIKGVK